MMTGAIPWGPDVQKHHVCMGKVTKFRRRFKRKASHTAYLYPIVIPIRDTESAYLIRLDCPTRLLLSY